MARLFDRGAGDGETFLARKDRAELDAHPSAVVEPETSRDAALDRLSVDVDPRAAELTGSLRFFVDVFNDGGAPCVGIGVYAVDLVATRRAPAAGAWRNTGENGSAEFRVEPGAYQIIVNSPRPGDDAAKRAGAEYSSLHFDVEVESDGERHSAVLATRFGSLGVLVIDDRGLGVPGIDVSVGDGLVRERTNEEGRVEFVALGAGPTEVFLGTHRDRRLPGYSCMQPLQECAIPYRGRGEVRFDVVRNGTLTVSLPRIPSEPDLRASVSLWTVRTEFDWTFPGREEVSQGGELRYDDLPPGEHRIVPTLPPTSRYRVTAFKTVTIEPGGGATSEIQLAEESRVIRGRVVDERLDGREGVLVKANATTDEWRKSVLTAADGTFEIWGVPSGEVLLFADPTQAKGEELAMPVANQAVPSDGPTAGQEVVLRLERGYRVRGFVPREQVEGLAVEIEPMHAYPVFTMAPGMRHPWSGAIGEGEFEFGFLRAGTYTLRYIDFDGNPLGLEKTVELGAAGELAPQIVDVELTRNR